jgi:hypothetical protein
MDEELVLINLAAVAQDLVESLREQKPGVYEIDQGIMNVFLFATKEANRYL